MIVISRSHCSQPHVGQVETEEEFLTGYREVVRELKVISGSSRYCLTLMMSKSWMSGRFSHCLM